MPSNTQYSEAEPARDQQVDNRQRDNHYVSHSTSTSDSDHRDYLPEGSLSVRKLNDSPVSLFGLCLVDSGSTSTLINERAVPPNVKPRLGDPQVVTTTQGTYSSKIISMHSKLYFPNFAKHE